MGLMYIFNISMLMMVLAYIYIYIYTHILSQFNVISILYINFKKITSEWIIRWLQIECFTYMLQDYKKYCCLSDDINDCFKKSTPIPKFAFLDATRAMNATKNVYMILPTIFHIITCDFMKLMFEEIIKQHCMPLKKCLTMLWVSFVSASLLLMLLLFCIIYIKYKLFNTPNLISDVGNSKNKITLSFCKPDV